MAAPAMARPNGTAAAGPVSAVSVGQAVLEATPEGFAGRVEAVFRDGFYVSGPSGALFAVLGPRSWPGPLHLIVEEPAELPALHDPVSVSGTVLRAGRLHVRLDRCSPWAPRLPERLTVAQGAWRSLDVSVDTELADVWEVATQGVRRGDLAAVFRHLQGRGGGLTPSGDDVLAGILLVCATNPSRRRALSDLALGVCTTRLSRAFLIWAAAGQSIQPAHALLDAAASGSHSGMRQAAEALAEVGATSGRAMVAGIALAATELPSTQRPSG